jgi:laccase
MIFMCVCSVVCVVAGMWIMHFHFDAHLPIVLAMAFEVQDMPTLETVLPPPSAGLPQC